MKSNLFFNTDDRFYFLFDPILSAFRNEEIHLRSTTSSAYLVRTHIAKEFRCLHLITFTIWNENLVPDSWHIRRSCSLSSFLLLTRCIEIPLPRSLTHLLTDSLSIPAAAAASMEYLPPPPLPRPVLLPRGIQLL